MRFARLRRVKTCARDFQFKHRTWPPVSRGQIVSQYPIWNFWRASQTLRGFYIQSCSGIGEYLVPQYLPENTFVEICLKAPLFCTTRACKRRTPLLERLDTSFAVREPFATLLNLVRIVRPFIEKRTPAERRWLASVRHVGEGTRTCPISTAGVTLGVSAFHTVVVRVPRLLRHL